jgi:lanosterol synthase
MVTTRSQANGASPLNKRKSNGDVVEKNAKRAKIQEKTDITRWRCLDEDGRLTWRYLEDDDDATKWPQSYADKWYLGLDLVGR